jgi:hypothetical protein
MAAAAQASLLLVVVLAVFLRGACALDRTFIANEANEAVCNRVLPLRMPCMFTEPHQSEVIWQVPAGEAPYTASHLDAAQNVHLRNDQQQLSHVH